ncbi:MAG TPA: type II toxin-antitoxin system VapC family toxin [Burkholderiaceae bacterium]|nr:type II toxin-antitoxin system VapC family toxin [Burkholderiaceae bacterium]
MPFVLDNSIVCGWFLENQATPYADVIIERLRDDRAVVPALWELEFTNVLRTACLRQRMTAEAAQRVIAQIVSLPIDVDRQAVPASEILGLALRFGLSSYDAAYLELALRLQLPIATGDGPLRAAALASGVGTATATVG